MDLEILNIASDTDNNRNIKNYTHFSKLKNSLCGDEIKIKLIIKDDKIIDFGYQGNTCIYCQASVSLLSKISINNKKSKLNELCDDAKLYFDGNFEIIEKKWLFLKKLFKKKNLLRKNCILLPFETLKKIISN
tara:strand:+ start:307 stop:705 length:399 start_codon:yes stop_codon:yes gene_type:complete